MSDYGGGRGNEEKDKCAAPIVSAKNSLRDKQLPTAAPSITAVGRKGRSGRSRV